jgi:hypothetical protein
MISTTALAIALVVALRPDFLREIHFIFIKNKA